ncbi:MAG: hypothetical protein WDN69_03250 [Aliidongia sp.]
MLLTRRTAIAMTALCASAPVRVLASACCGPITPAGARLAAFLDSSGVDHLWLPGYKVNWDTGAMVSAWNDDRPHTHCSAFVASAAKRLRVYVLRPPEHSPVLLANAQMGWLRSPEATSKGWRPVADAAEAQARANRGDLVVAAIENPDPDRPGHIAIVRPSEIDTATLLADGPFVTQAGGHNALSVALVHGFANHKGAWAGNGGGEVRFFAHPVDWSRAEAAT